MSKKTGLRGSKKEVHVWASKTAPRLWDFKASSLERTVGSIRPNERLLYPLVYYSARAWDTLWFVVHNCTKEVGWLGLVDDLGSKRYLVTDIFVPKQTVSSVSTDIESEDLAELAMALLDEGIDTSKLIYWGHSHVEMGVSPSAQDEDQLDEYLTDNPLFIRGIYNKRGESKVDVFDMTDRLVYQSVANRIFTPGLSRDEMTHLSQVLKNNVEERKLTPVHRYPQVNGVV